MVHDRPAAAALLPKGGAGPIGHDRARAAGLADLRDRGQTDPGARAQAGWRADNPSHGRKTPIGALNGRHYDMFLALIEDCHVDRRPISPKAEQAPAALSQPRRQEPPEILVHDDSRAWPMPFDTSSIRDQLGKRRHKWLFLFPLKSDLHALTKQARDVLKPSHQRRRQINSRCQNETKMTGHRQVGGLHRSGTAFRRAKRKSLQA